MLIDTSQNQLSIQLQKKIKTCLLLLQLRQTIILQNAFTVSKIIPS